MPNGDKVSALGFGTLRLPVTKAGKVDREKAGELIASAMDSGINYYDTAYIYGEGEESLAEALSKFDRDSYFLATKMPLPSIKQPGDMAKIFEDQLSRLKTGRIDYYLLHNVNSYEEYARLKSLGFWDLVEEKKKAGQIRSVGFSFHASLHHFKKIVDGGPWDFCQIQYNYIDEDFQAGTQGLKYASAKGLGVVVMEPLRGGRLVSLMPEESKRLIEAHPVLRTPAEWGLRWVMGHAEATVTLSGMNTFEQIRENARIADEALPGCISPQDQELLTKLKLNFEKGQKIACTGCSYCMPCPRNVDIPTCFALYNNQKMFGGRKYLEQYIYYLDGFESPPSRASLCVSCGACMQKCPQGLEVPILLKKVRREMERPWLRYHYRFLRYLAYRYNRVKIHSEPGQNGKKKVIWKR
jgi:predicted aldo/keto reductase-like oxidoreductase